MSEDVRRLVDLAVREDAAATGGAVHNALSLLELALNHTRAVGVGLGVGGEDVGDGTDEAAPVEVGRGVGEDGDLRLSAQRERADGVGRVLVRCGAEELDERLEGRVHARLREEERVVVHAQVQLGHCRACGRALLLGREEEEGQVGGKRAGRVGLDLRGVEEADAVQRALGLEVVDERREGDNVRCRVLLAIHDLAEDVVERHLSSDIQLEENRRCGSRSAGRNDERRVGSVPEEQDHKRRQQQVVRRRQRRGRVQRRELVGDVHECRGQRGRQLELLHGLDHLGGSCGGSQQAARGGASSSQ